MRDGGEDAPGLALGPPADRRPARGRKARIRFERTGPDTAETPRLQPVRETELS